jgi:hypothetical protein
MALALLSKQSAFPLVGLFFINAITSLKRTGIALLVFFMTGVIWFMFYIHPNQAIVGWNWDATVGGNRPRSAFLDSSYASSQLYHAVIGPLWLYLPGFFVVPFMAIFEYKKGDLIFRSSAVWFLFLVGYFILIPSQYGRFFIQGLIPITLMIAYMLCCSKNYLKYTVIASIIMSTIFSIYSSFSTWVIRPDYSYKIAASKIHKIVGNELTEAPLELTVYEKFNNVATYGIPPSSIGKYYELYSYPRFIVTPHENISQAQYKKFIRIGKYTMYAIPPFGS